MPDAQILAESAGGKACGLIFESAREVVVTKTTGAVLIEQAERSFAAEAVALRALDEHALMARTFETLGAGRTSPVWRENAPPAGPATAEEAAEELARMTRMSEDDFGAATAAWAGGHVASLDAARPRSPFMRGLTGLPTA